MKTFRRSLVVVALLVSAVGFASTATSATSSATASPSPRTVVGCCYLFLNGKWMCVQC